MISSEFRVLQPTADVAKPAVRNTFVSPSAYASPDIVCHLAATPAGAEAPVNAGDVIEIQWTPGPASHKGPVLNYLANCK
jgi:cellulase